MAEGRLILSKRGRQPEKVVVIFGDEVYISASTKAAIRDR